MYFAKAKADYLILDLNNEESEAMLEASECSTAPKIIYNDEWEDTVPKPAEAEPGQPSEDDHRDIAEPSDVADETKRVNQEDILIKKKKWEDMDRYFTGEMQ